MVTAEIEDINTYDYKYRFIINQKSPSSVGQTLSWEKKIIEINCDLIKKFNYNQYWAKLNE